MDENNRPRGRNCHCYQGFRHADGQRGNGEELHHRIRHDGDENPKIQENQAGYLENILGLKNFRGKERCRSLYFQDSRGLSLKISLANIVLIKMDNPLRSTDIACDPWGEGVSIISSGSYPVQKGK